MASSITRRPLPALISLLALLVLTALVWWRVLHRDDSSGAAAKPCPTTSASTSAPPPPPLSTLPGPGTVTVQVLNATKRSGIAGKARTTLVGDGFSSPNPAANDNPKTKIAGVAEIRYGAKGKQGARLLRYYFPGATLVPNKKMKSPTVIVSLGNKYVAVATPSAVTKAMQTARVGIASNPATPPSGATSGSGSAGASAPASGSPASPRASSSC